MARISGSAARLPFPVGRNSWQVDPTFMVSDGLQTSRVHVKADADEVHVPTPGKSRGEFKMKWTTLTAALLIVASVNVADAGLFGRHNRHRDCCAPAPTCCEAAPTCAAPCDPGCAAPAAAPACCAPAAAPVCAAPAAAPACCAPAPEACCAPVCKPRRHRDRVGKRISGWFQRMRHSRKSDCCAPAPACCAPVDAGCAAPCPPDCAVPAGACH